MHCTHERITTTLSANLIKIRGKQHMTQHSMAAAVGIKQSRYASYEEGRCHPNVATCLAICQVGGVTMDQLLTSKLK